METAGLDPHMFHDVLQERKLSAGIVITFQVMAIAGMSTGDPYAVGPLPQCGQDKLGTHPPGAGYADDPYVRRILHPADTCKIGGAVTAPVAQKSKNFRFPIRHCKHLLF